MDRGPHQKSSTRGPLSIGMLGFSAASKMANFKKKNQLKNRGVI